MELAKEFLPTIAQAMRENNPKLTVTIGDGLAHVREKEDYYDVIIVDCSDPIGPGEGLFQEPFYKDVYKALKEDGLFVQQTESPFLHQPLILYPAGMHCFTMGSKKYDPLTWTPNRPKTFETKYYNEDIQKAAFALPNFVFDILPKK